MKPRSLRLQSLKSLSDKHCLWTWMLNYRLELHLWVNENSSWKRMNGYVLAHASIRWCHQPDVRASQAISVVKSELQAQQRQLQDHEKQLRDRESDLRSKLQDIEKGQQLVQAVSKARSYDCMLCLINCIQSIVRMIFTISIPLWWYLYYGRVHFTL